MMKFWLGDDYISLSFAYPEQSAVTLCKIVIENHPAYPLGFVGSALCSSNDNFDKETGRKISLRRALEVAGFDKNQRTFIWNMYHGRTVGLSPETAFLLTYLSEAELEHLNTEDAYALAIERDKHAAESLLMSMEA